MRGPGEMQRGVGERITPLGDRHDDSGIAGLPTCRLTTQAHQDGLKQATRRLTGDDMKVIGTMMAAGRVSFCKPVSTMKSLTAGYPLAHDAASQRAQREPNPMHLQVTYLVTRSQRPRSCATSSCSTSAYPGHPSR
jgi:hypothetical protein